MKKEKSKVSILIEGIDRELKLSKVTSINIDNPDKQMIHLDKLKDGTWRLIYNSSLIPDIKEVKSFKIIRDKKEILNKEK